MITPNPCRTRPPTTYPTQPHLFSQLLGFRMFATFFFLVLLHTSNPFGGLRSPALLKSRFGDVIHTDLGTLLRRNRILPMVTCCWDTCKGREDLDLGMLVP
ncbi:hypothetical protein BDR03DRAFT_360897 [Suillus americanus]|nr:hypothetical protein BDR03DRAFT_360897 [Suillus americanus]